MDNLRQLRPCGKITRQIGPGAKRLLPRAGQDQATIGGVLQTQPNVTQFAQIVAAERITLGLVVHDDDRNMRPMFLDV